MATTEKMRKALEYVQNQLEGQQYGGEHVPPEGTMEADMLKVVKEALSPE